MILWLTQMIIDDIMINTDDIMIDTDDIIIDIDDYPDITLIKNSYQLI